MVIAALIVFALLLATWILAPTEAQARESAAPELIDAEEVPQAA